MYLTATLLTCTSIYEIKSNAINNMVFNCSRCKLVYTLVGMILVEEVLQLSKSPPAIENNGGLSEDYSLYSCVMTL